MEPSGESGPTPESAPGRGLVWVGVVLFSVVVGVLIAIRVDNGWLVALALPMVAFSLAVAVRVVAVMRGQ